MVGRIACDILLFLFLFADHIYLTPHTLTAQPKLPGAQTSSSIKMATTVSYRHHSSLFVHPLSMNKIPGPTMKLLKSSLPPWPAQTEAHFLINNNVYV